jgi:hypothetical protein
MSRSSSEKAASRSAAEEIERRVVRDAEEPTLDLRNELQLRHRLQRFHHRVLHHVLAVDGRAGHARAIAMQLRPHLAEHTVEGRADLRGISVVVAHCASAVVSGDIALLP